MVRKVISLNGIWELSMDRRFRYLNTYTISVPSCIGSEIPALRDYRGILWYRKRFSIDRISPQEAFLLHFGAVNYHSQVWLNHTLIGTHEGGYTPFIFDVTKLIKAQNELVVRVLIPGNIDPEYSFGEIPHGKQETHWYGIASGIWQNVALIRTGKPYITKLYITPDVEQKRALVTTKSKLIGVDKQCQLALSIIDPYGKLIDKINIPLSPENRAEFSISNVMPWDTDNPNLYMLNATIFCNGKPIDEVLDMFGMRRVEIKNGQIFLNGKSIYLVGALDQDFYPYSHYTPPNEEFVRDELILAKEMGLNCLRYHVKVPHPWYLKWADRLGILIWEDLPNWSESTSEAKSRGKVTLKEMIELDYNHPSVIIRTIINESWGLDLTKSEDRKWLRNTYNWLKAKDPTRLVVDNSACFSNFHLKTDIEDFHNYFAFPDHFNSMKSWVAEFSGHPSWTFDSNGKRSGIEPLLISEFGNWGLPNIAKLRSQYGGDPWWFQQGDPQKGTRPLGVEEKFWEYGLGKVFNSIEELSEASQSLQTQALHFQIEEIRKYPEIQGYIITEFTDLYWEANGLLDITRGKKAHFDRLKHLNALDIIFPSQRPAGIWASESIKLKLLFSHLSHKELKNIRINWNIKKTKIKGSLILKKIEQGLSTVGNIEFIPPSLLEPNSFKLFLKASFRNRTICENEIDLFVVPKDLLKNIKSKLSVADESLNMEFHSLDTELYPPEEADVIYATNLSDSLERWAEQGKSVILELSEDSEFSHFGYTLRKRKGPEEGRWVNGIGILHPLFAGRTFREKILDYRFLDSFPTHYLQGEFNFNTKTLAGMILGWVYHPMNFIVKIPLGKGTIILSTFPMRNKLSTSPTMRVLLYQLVRLAKNGKKT